MILTTEQYKILASYIGYGVMNKPLICFFGNESGTGGMTTDTYIPKFIKDLQTWDKYVFKGGGFVLSAIHDLPVSSIFLQFIGRLMLAIEHKDENWFGSLSTSGISFLNNYIINRFNKENTCVFNLRPLPRPTERIWPYENIDERHYINSYNFKLKRPVTDEFKEIRMNAFKNGFVQIGDALIIGIGDKENKKLFFENLFKCSFLLFENMYICKDPNIILCNYFDNKHGIGLLGLQKLYRYISTI